VPDPDVTERRRTMARAVYILVPLVAALLFGGDQGKPAAIPIPQSAIPQALERTDAQGLREWVQFDTIKKAGGDLDLNAFSAETRRSIVANLSRIGTESGGASLLNPCEIGILHADGSWPGPQVAGKVTLTEFASVIVHGSVVSLTPGLRFGDPGTMVDVSVEEVPKGVWQAPMLSVFVRSASFRVQGKVVCVSTTDPAPELGDEILVFLDAASSSSGALYVTSPPGVILLRAPGERVRGPRMIVNTTTVRSFPPIARLATLVQQLELMDK
jgi:hypothetical protein